MLKGVMSLATPKVPLVKSNEKHVPIDLANAGRPVHNFYRLQGKAVYRHQPSINFKQDLTAMFNMI